MRLLFFFALLPACTETVEITGTGYAEATAAGPDGIELPLAIWYPADVTEADVQAEYALGITGDAWADAPPATGPFPIIVNSHGNGGARHAGAVLFEEWAAAGYVVVSLDHVGNTFTDRPSVNEWVDIYIRRPADLAAAYTEVVSMSEAEDGVLSGMVDAETLILSGHSTGGATVILASGGTLNRATVLLACGANQIGGNACTIAESDDSEEIDLTPEGLPDPVATIAMAPLNGNLFSPSLDMAGASLVIVGTRDDVTPSGSNATPLFEAMPSPKTLVELQGANHYAFATICGVPGLSDLLPSVASQCDDPSYMSEADAIDATAAISLEFMSKWVAQDEDADVGAVAAGFDVTIEAE